VRGPKLAILLAAAAIAVGIQNYVFWFGSADPRVASVRQSGDDGGDSAAAGRFEPEILDAASLAAWLAAHPPSQRNPFFSASEELGLGGSRPAVSQGLPHLSGTLWSPARRVAWLDGRPRSEGDWVGDYRLAVIEASHVVLERSGSRVPLYVDPGVLPASTPSIWPAEAPTNGN
jgi:hypothetical protein